MKIKTEIYREMTDGTEMEITVEADYCREQPSYFDKVFGNYLPGDPEQFEICDAYDKNGNPVELTKKEEEQVWNNIPEDEDV
jgi:hypothetical protein